MLRLFLWNPAVFVATIGVLLAVPAALSVLSAGRTARLVVSRCHGVPVPLPEDLPAPAGVYRLGRVDATRTPSCSPATIAGSRGSSRRGTGSRRAAP